MSERKRVRCPCCRMMPDMEHLWKVTDELADVRLIVQKFGGKNAVKGNEGENYKKVGRGKAPGSITYEDITATSPGEVHELENWFAKRAKSFLSSLK